MLKDVGVNPYLLEMANLREQCSWVHMSSPADATLKAHDLVKMAVSRARLLQPLQEEILPLTKKTMIIDNGLVTDSRLLGFIRITESLVIKSKFSEAISVNSFSY